MNIIPVLILLFIYSGNSIHSDHHEKEILPFSDRLAKAVALSNSLCGGTGVSAAVIIEGEGRWEGVAGYSSIDQPVDSDMLLNVASTGKTFLAMLILNLVEEGKLSLDDNISNWLTGDYYIDGSVTVRQLLNHTSGIFDWVEHPDSPYRIPFDSIDHTEISSSEEVISKLLADPLFRPGEEFYYSTTNYNILRIIAEKVTGNGLADEISRRFLVPLSLDNTFILDSLTDLPGSAHVVHPWYDTDGDGIKDDISNNDIKWIVSRSPCFVYSTATDLAVWIHSIFNHKVLGDSLLTKVLDFCTLLQLINSGEGIDILSIRLINKYNVMKKLTVTSVFLVILTIAFLAFNSCRGRWESNNDKEMILSVIKESYVNGIHTTQNEDTIRKGFHNDFRMIVYNDSEIEKVSIADWLVRIEKMKKENPAFWNEKTRCDNYKISISGNAASAQMDTYKGDIFFSTDFLLLYKFPDGWKIVTKIFTTEQD